MQVETSLPNPAEHRRRVEGRAADIPGHVMPPWAEVCRAGWTPWDEDRDGPRLLIDTTDRHHALEALLATTPQADRDEDLPVQPPTARTLPRRG